MLSMEWVLEILENLRNYIQLADLIDIVDILIVAFIIYKLLGLIRNTTAAQVLKGIALLLVLLGISAMLQLKMLNFIMRNTMQVGLTAVIVLFQPELRKMLESAGASRFPKLIIGKSENDHTRMEMVIAQTVNACSALSQQKIGALIVFERKVFLNDAIKTGTPLDAQVSNMLLRNLFFPKAALHDGAVIIRDGRIVAAGCMLPLSDNIHLSRDLGMRHRAGVGISEQSDAVVIIVSEETGSISVAVGGMLKRHINAETLSVLLKNELITPQEDPVKKGVFGFLRRVKGKKDENE